MIIKDGRILLTRRASTKKFFPDCWTFPGGGIEEYDETLEKAAIREVKEEVGLDFILEKKLNFYEGKLEDFRFISHVFIGKGGGNIRIQESEVIECGWFTYEETGNLKFAFAYREVIEDLHKLNIL